MVVKNYIPKIWGPTILFYLECDYKRVFLKHKYQTFTLSDSVPLLDP